MKYCMNIDIICKIIDNYGDIGVVYRLIKAFLSIDKTITLRLLIDDLHSFSLLNPKINPLLPKQIFDRLTVYNCAMYHDDFCINPPTLIIEAFASGRPSWYETIIFNEKICPLVHIINLEYLTAESWADDMHEVASLTRSSHVKKWIFMPGFTSKTGGLIIDPHFKTQRDNHSKENYTNQARLSLLEKIHHSASIQKDFWIPIFTYPHNFAAIIDDFQKFHKVKPICVFLSKSLCCEGFMSLWKSKGMPFPVIELPFLSQEIWDELLLCSDFAFIRGEESFSRMCLVGKPFIWHAYVQDEMHHLVKVNAFLDQLEPFASEEDFKAIKQAYIAFNAHTTYDFISKSDETILPLLHRYEEIKKIFTMLGEKLLLNGDLASHLLFFIRKLV